MGPPVLARAAPQQPAGPPADKSLLASRPPEQIKPALGRWPKGQLVSRRGRLLEFAHRKPLERGLQIMTSRPLLATRILSGTAALLAALILLPALAAAEGVLDRIRAQGEVRLAYR